MRDNERILTIVNFKKTNSNIYMAEMDEEEFLTYLDDIINSFTIASPDDYSKLVNLPLYNVITTRVIADAFIFKHPEVIKKAELGVEINVTMRGSTRIVKIAFNANMGGYVFGMEM